MAIAAGGSIGVGTPLGTKAALHDITMRKEKQASTIILHSFKS
jgi:hypothetical protein